MKLQLFVLKSIKFSKYVSDCVIKEIYKNYILHYVGAVRTDACYLYLRNQHYSRYISLLPHASIPSCDFERQPMIMYLIFPLIVMTSFANFFTIF